MTAKGTRIFVAAIPDELKALRQWVGYRLVWDEQRQKFDKPPLNVYTGQLASTTDPGTWADFRDAIAAYKRNAVDGVGFVFTADDEFVGIDIDACYNPDTEELQPWADEVLLLFESYTELSPSGKGIHIIVRGSLPGPGRNQRPFETYDQARFFTFTGQVMEGLDVIHERSGELEAFYRSHFKDTSSYHVANDADLIEMAMAAANGEKFTRLWRGDDADYAGDASAADLGLANMLLFWSEGDSLRADRLFRSSARLRAKWDEIHFGNGETYGQHTIGVAFETWRREHGSEFGSTSYERAEPEPEPPKMDAITTFPMDALPHVVRNFARDWAHVVSSVPEAIALPCLAFASGAIGRTRVLRVTSRFIVSALLWVGIIGEPGSAKSAAIEEAGRWLSARDQQMFTEYEEAVDDYRWRLSQLKKGDRPADPPRRRHRVMGDATTEAVGKVLHEDGHGVVMVHDELAGWIGAFNQYRAKGTGSDRQRFLAIWSGAELRVDRVRDDSSYIVPHPFMAICGGIQPDLLGLLSNDLGNDGFLMRFLFAAIPSLPSVGIAEPTVNDDSIRQWNSTIDDLLAGESEEIITFTPAGSAAWKRGSADWAAQMNHPDFDPRMRSFYAKGHLLSARVALVLHCIKEASGEVDEPSVDESTSIAAWQLMGYFASTMRYVVLRIAETETDKLIDRLVEYAYAHGGSLTNRDAQRLGVAGLKSQTEIVSAFQKVHDYGRGTVEREQVQGGTRWTLRVSI
jgi:hypothetical protein